MNHILTIINTNSSLIIFSMLIIIICLTIITFINSIKLSSIKRKHLSIMHGMKNKNLENVILEYYSKVDGIIKENKDIKEEIEKIQDTLGHCAQKIGIVRYSAFENVGGDMSFAVAILDKKDSGFVLNGIYSRESSATYLKPIAFGKCEYTLSQEESKAIDLAKNNFARKLMHHTS